MPEDASRQLLDFLCSRAEVPEYQCRLRWRKNSIAFWDNRRVEHYAVADYYPKKRIMHRITICGDEPYKPCTSVMCRADQRSIGHRLRALSPKIQQLLFRVQKEKLLSRQVKLFLKAAIVRRREVGAPKRRQAPKLSSRRRKNSTQCCGQPSP